MLTNLTIDDTSQDIIYSSNWAPQLSSDPNTDLFFQSTYHSAQADGASANITFTGSAIYLYGTKGPSHANYSVQFDNLIIFLSANAPETLYQQPLFAFTFSTTGSHFISLTSHSVTGGSWLDLDYMTITVNDTEVDPSSPSGVNMPSASQSISPPWLTLSSTTSQPSFPTSTQTSLPIPTSVHDNAASSKASTITLILSIAFGIFIALGILLFLLLYFCRRRLRPARVVPQSNMFDYKIAPDHSPQVSPAFVVPDIYTTQPTINSRSRNTLNPGHAQGLHGGSDISRSASPWSGVSGDGATALTQQSQSQSQLSTAALLGTRHPPQAYAHTRTTSHARNGSQPVFSPLSQQTFDTQQTLIPARSTNRFGKVFDFLSKPPPDPRYQHRPSTSQTSLPRSPPPDCALPAPPAAPPRPQRPQEGLLDWLGNSVDVVAERSQTTPKTRKDDSSEWTNFLKV